MRTVGVAATRHRAGIDRFGHFAGLTALRASTRFTAMTPLEADEVLGKVVFETENFVLRAKDVDGNIYATVNSKVDGVEVMRDDYVLGSSALRTQLN